MRGGERTYSRQRLVGLSALTGLLAAAFLALSAGPALALYVHPDANEGMPFGRDGTDTTDFPPLFSIAFDQASDHVNPLAINQFGGSGNGLYGFDASTLGTYTPLGGNFPLDVSNSAIGENDIAVDNSSQPTAGHIYYGVNSGGRVYGFDSLGAPLGGIYNPDFRPYSIGGGLSLRGVAVTPAGTLSLSHGGDVDWFDPTTGALLNRIDASHEEVGSPARHAYDSQSNLYLIQKVAGLAGIHLQGTVWKYTAASGYTQATRIDASPAIDVEVDRSTDTLYVAHRDRVDAYGPGGGKIETFATGPSPLGAPDFRGIAVDEGTHTVFVSDQGELASQVRVFPSVVAPTPTTGAVSNVTSTAVTANGHVELAGGPDVQECRFEYATAEAYDAVGFAPAVTGSVPCEPATPYSGATDVSADLTDLRPGTAYRLRLVAGNGDGAGPSPVASFQTTGPPVVRSLSTSEVSADSARVHARIDPQGLDTDYRVEYGTTTTFGVSAPLPEAELAAGFGLQSVAIDLTGLSASEYFFRVVATNSEGTTASETSTFSFYPPSCPNAAVRQQTGAAYLPDCRAYELVSPEYAAGTTLYSGGPQSATANDRYAFTGQFGEIPGAGTPINTTGDLYIATRAASGWSTKYIGPPPQATGCAGGPPALSGAGWATTVHNTVIADEGLDRMIDWPAGNGHVCLFETIGVDTRPTYSGTISTSSNAPYEWSASGQQLDRWPTGAADVAGSAEDFNCKQDPSGDAPGAGANCTTQVGASRDLSHFVFSTQAAGIYNLPGARSDAPGSAYDNDTNAGTLSLISLKPDGSPIGQESPDNGGPDELIQFPHVSEDGSRILMGTKTNEECHQEQYPSFYKTICPIVANPTHLYMRVNDSITYDIAGQPVSYVDSTPDGKKVYFTSPDQLVAEDTDASVDLYMWDENGGSPELTLLSRGSGGGNGDDCGATWIADCDVETYDDSTITDAPGNRGGLSPIWTWDKAVYPYGKVGGLTDNAVASESGDIYFYSPEVLVAGAGIPGSTNLYLFRDGTVRHVATLDRTPYCIAANKNDLRSSTACSAGPVGRIQVTPDGRYAAFVTGSQITAYDNDGKGMMYRYDALSGEIVCVSCRTDGTPPSFDAWGSQAGRFITDDGRVFFDTAEPLVPQDTNVGTGVDGQELGHDIYEFVGGRPQLITPGTGVGQGGLLFVAESAAGLFGVSANGANVFFGSFDPLVANDRNASQLSIYTARTNGGFPLEPPSLPCEAADECHGETSSAPAPIADATGAALRGGNASPARARANRCAVAARQARRASAIAKRMRRQARKAAASRQRTRARRMALRARRTARSARRNANRAKRCRASARRARAARRAAR